jgi:hypothetical protein
MIRQSGNQWLVGDQDKVNRLGAAGEKLTQ